MELLGRLAGGVAHDLNNLVTVMLGYSEILEHQTGPNSPLTADIREIQKAGDRAASLTRQLLAFSRRQDVAPAQLSLNTLIGDMEPMLRRLIREDIELITALQPDLGQTKADPAQIEQVVMNLVLNARDAMLTGGRLTVRTANALLDRAAAERFGGLQPGSYVAVAVSDSGCGMDRETLDHLFEPFFTTKEQGRGTGLGLCIVSDIVNQHGGAIDVASELGRGTTVTVYLPRVDGAGGPAYAREGLGGPSPRGCETVLVVEDNENIRALVREILKRHGYHVLEAREVSEAFEICERHPGPIHLLVTDVVMPQMNARELAARLTPLCPGMKVLCMSGYANADLEDMNLLTPDVPFLQKPFTPQTLTRKVRQLLDS
jgi:CheY-like chemotaxis protein